MLQPAFKNYASKVDPSGSVESTLPVHRCLHHGWFAFPPRRFGAWDLCNYALTNLSLGVYAWLYIVYMDSCKAFVHHYCCLWNIVAFIALDIISECNSKF